MHIGWTTLKDIKALTTPPRKLGFGPLPPALLLAYVSCDRIIGLTKHCELEGQHTHRVCILAKDNDTKLFGALVKTARAIPARKRRRAIKKLEKSSKPPPAPSLDSYLEIGDAQEIH